MRFAAMNLGHLRISTRVVTLVGILSVMLIGIVGGGLYGIRQTDGSLKRVYKDRTAPMDQVAEIQHLILHNRQTIANALLDPTPEVSAQDTATLEADITAFAKEWNA
jgi:methyl-accepting chemotaxis protein-1 (serine sensor receptor)